MRKMRTKLGRGGRGVRLAAGLLSGLLALSASCMDQASSDEVESRQRASGSASAEYDQRTVIVKFRDVATATAVVDAVALVGGTFEDKDLDRRDDRFRHVAGGRLALIELGRAFSVEQAVATLARHPAIEYVEPNRLVRLERTPDDPLLGEVWNLHNSGQLSGVHGADISALSAWDISVGSHDIVVGVLDTGIDYNHPDMAPNLFVNPGEIPNNGIDDDDSGYIDDVYGIDINNDDGDPMDDGDHGTHVAGIIGAAGDDGVGLVGVNWNVSIMSLKFMEGFFGQGTVGGAIMCLDYAVMMKNRGVNIRALNNSWGLSHFHQSLEDAIASVNDAGILFVASAGNSSEDNDVVEHYPSNHDVPNVVAVAATSRTDDRAAFSNYGLTTVHLGAPGTNVLSAMPDNEYAAFSGTSMAAPHVTGAAALVLSVNDALTVTELKQILMDTGDPVPGLAGRTISGKRLDIERALEATLAVPAFRVEIPTTSTVVNQGQTATYPVAVASLLGFAEPVALSLSSTPALNAVATFTPDLVPAGTSASLTIATTTATAPGDYTLTITGTSGALTRTRTVLLTVRPEGAIERSYTNSTPIPIPQLGLGIESFLTVPDELSLVEVQVALNVTHQRHNDLKATLRAPAGAETVFLDQNVDGFGNQVLTFRVHSFDGQGSNGTWRLHVRDQLVGRTGTLNSWTITVVGVPAGAPINQPPVAGFASSTQGLLASFTDTSADPDGAIVARSWSFGDGGASTAQHPSHTYAAAGTYTVTLTVTDDAGATDTVSHDVTVTEPAPAISLVIVSARRNGQRSVDVTIGWSGASSASVEVHRNGTFVGSKPNTGTYRDRFVSTDTTFSYVVCEAGGAPCSNVAIADL